MRRMVTAGLLGLLLLTPGALGATTGPAITSEEDARALVDSLAERTGQLVVGDARIDLPTGYRYLEAADARRVIVDLIGNPPEAANGVRALILAPGEDALDNRYFVVVGYDDEGHVDDDDADGIDYDELLRGEQKAADEGNAARTSAGYPAMTVVGWAETPRYDGTTHKLYWARQLHFDGEEADTLNYEVRVLGRESTLDLTAVAGAADLAPVRDGMQTILAASSFVPERAYEDFEDGDRRSNLTVGALVAGGAYAAAKTGVIAFLLAKAKLILIGLAALGGVVGRLLRGRRGTSPESPEPEPDATSEADGDGDQGDNA